MITETETAAEFSIFGSISAAADSVLGSSVTAGCQLSRVTSCPGVGFLSPTAWMGVGSNGVGFRDILWCRPDDFHCGLDGNPFSR
jgi:hypothetical protein